jgi:phosphocarrier protein HPr
MTAISSNVVLETGFYIRYAAMFVNTAVQFDSDISVTYGDRTANAKRILDLLVLGALDGAEITISAEGDDAEAALAALEELVINNFGE